MNRLQGKVAIITGAATGIGEANANLFAREGAKIVIADINYHEGEKVANSIRKDGGQARFIKLDVTSETDWKNVIEQTIIAYDKLNILVNNAGVSVAKSLEDTRLDEWNWTMDVNSTGVFLGTKYAIEAMKGNGELCSIINISSVAALVGDATLAAYCASKGAVTAFTKAAALYCAEKGYSIRVNAVHPAVSVSTAMTKKEASDLGLTTEEFFKGMKTKLPLAVTANGGPSDIALLDLYIASDESKWVTGSVLVIDGGYTAQ